MFAAVLALAMSLGAFTPAGGAASLAVVEETCAAVERPQTCDDDLGRILQLLLVQQSQLIQEEEEHPARDSVLATQVPHGRTDALPSVRVLEGEDMSPALLRPPRSQTV